MRAKELIDKRLYVTDDGEPESVHDSVSNVKDTMIEFAKYHVEQTLKKAATEAKVEEIDFLQDFNEIPSIQYGVNSKSILKAYPLENIK